MSLPMPVAPGADPRSFPLIRRLFDLHGYAEVDAAGIDAFASGPGRTLLVFTDDPVRVRETLDLAVIVPEIDRAFAGRMRVGVLLPEAAREAQPRYGFRRSPALVMLAQGRYVGAVDGLRGWDEYLAAIATLLDAPPSRAPSIGIAVRGEGAAAGNGQH